MIAEDATKKVKFSGKLFLQYMVQHFIVLVRFTDQGIRNVKDTKRRAEAALEFGMRIASVGNIRTTTLKAFSEEEIARVVDKLG